VQKNSLYHTHKALLMVTAEKFYLKVTEPLISNSELNKDICLHLMKEFAKLHVEAALEAAKENAKASLKWKSDMRKTGYGTMELHIDEDTILKAYPLNKIV